MTKTIESRSGVAKEPAGEERESPEGMPMGISLDTRMVSRRTSFVPGDVLLAVTDGITESSRFFGRTPDALSHLLAERASRGSNATSIATAVFDAAAVDGGITDDAAILCIRRIS